MKGFRIISSSVNMPQPAPGLNRRISILYKYSQLVWVIALEVQRYQVVATRPRPLPFEWIFRMLIGFNFD